MAGRPRRRARLLAEDEARKLGEPPPRRRPVNTPASGIRAGGPGKGDASGIPASHRLAPAPIVHGARSPRVYGELAQILAAGLSAERPDLAAFPEAVAAWATSEAQAALLRRHLAEVGPVDPDTAKPRTGSLDALRQFERLAAESRRTLGLDPRSEAQLARDRAAAVALTVDLDALAERGRQALAGQVVPVGSPPQLDPAPTVLLGVDDLAGEVLAAERAAYLAEWAQAQPGHAKPPGQAVQADNLAEGEA
ncbi:hypothetical protein [Micropruina sp.]|uniref:hypothetical protein n=1 Tax=Micropruina sp. TaxID=2737536 RepID=UPI0039E729B7